MMDDQLIIHRRWWIPGTQATKGTGAFGAQEWITSQSRSYTRSFSFNRADSTSGSDSHSFAAQVFNVSRPGMEFWI